MLLLACQWKSQVLLVIAVTGAERAKLWSEKIDCELKSIMMKAIKQMCFQPRTMRLVRLFNHLTNKDMDYLLM